MARLRLSDRVNVVPIQSGVLIRSDLGTFALEGDDVRLFITAVLPLLDGSRDENMIADELQGYTRESVVNVLDQLRQRGLLQVGEEAEHVEEQPWRAQLHFFRVWSDSPSEVF